MLVSHHSETFSTRGWHSRKNLWTNLGCENIWNLCVCFSFEAIFWNMGSGDSIRNNVGSPPMLFFGRPVKVQRTQNKSHSADGHCLTERGDNPSGTLQLLVWWKPPHVMMENWPKKKHVPPIAKTKKAFWFLIPYPLRIQRSYRKWSMYGWFTPAFTQLKWWVSIAMLNNHRVNIWRCPKMGVPPVIIHFNRIFPYKPSSYWGIYPYPGRPSSRLAGGPPQRASSSAATEDLKNQRQLQIAGVLGPWDGFEAFWK